MFLFFFDINRKNIISFCGSQTTILFDIEGPSCKECFRLYEDGFYKNGKSIISKHPNILKSVLIGKKGWGLWVQEYSDGIVEFSFTKDEILYEFSLKGIEIPESFLKDFENTINKKKIKRNLLYLYQRNLK